MALNFDNDFIVVLTIMSTFELTYYTKFFFSKASSSFKTLIIYA